VNSKSWNRIHRDFPAPQLSKVGMHNIKAVKCISLHCIGITGQGEMYLKDLFVEKLPEGYTVEPWNDKYFDAAVEVINLGFKNSKDVLFDPRFLTTEGCSDVISKITGNIFGHFMPEETRVILKDGNVEGVCFVNMVTPAKANIPLISVRKNIRNKGLGKFLLKSAVIGIIKALSEQKIAVSEVNAAVETDNYPALKMYRRVGFREDYTYPHAYYKNPNYKES